MSPGRLHTTFMLELKMRLSPTVCCLLFLTLNHPRCDLYAALYHLLFISSRNWVFVTHIRIQQMPLCASNSIVYDAIYAITIMPAERAEKKSISPFARVRWFFFYCSAAVVWIAVVCFFLCVLAMAMCYHRTIGAGITWLRYIIPAMFYGWMKCLRGAIISTNYQHQPIRGESNRNRERRREREWM